MTLGLGGGGEVSVPMEHLSSTSALFLSVKVSIETKIVSVLRSDNTYVLA